jgi:hypothetical protein
MNEAGEGRRRSTPVRAVMIDLEKPFGVTQRLLVVIRIRQFVVLTPSLKNFFSPSRRASK